MTIKLPPSPFDEILKYQLRRFLNTQRITRENIGKIRRRCFVPRCSEWNALVRDETAKRERNK